MKWHSFNLNQTVSQFLRKLYIFQKYFFILTLKRCLILFHLSIRAKEILFNRGLTILYLFIRGLLERSFRELFFSDELFWNQYKFIALICSSAELWLFLVKY